MLQIPDDVLPLHGACPNGRFGSDRRFADTAIALALASLVIGAHRVPGVVEMLDRREECDGDAIHSLDGAIPVAQQRVVDDDESVGLRCRDFPCTEPNAVARHDVDRSKLHPMVCWRLGELLALRPDALPDDDLREQAFHERQASKHALRHRSEVDGLGDPGGGGRGNLDDSCSDRNLTFWTSSVTLPNG